MALVSLLLKIGIAILMADAIVQMALLSSMVRWLNAGASGPYAIHFGDSTFNLAAEPLHILVNQGHTANAAGGSALILVGFGGIVALFLRSQRNYDHSVFSQLWYRSWLGLGVLATMLTLGTLIYVNVVTAQHDGQKIDIEVASKLDGKYPLDSWTPQNWFAAVLKLPLADGGVESEIRRYLQIMNGWRWNLIPLFILELAVCVLAFLDARRRRRPVYEVAKEGHDHFEHGNQIDASKVFCRSSFCWCLVLAFDRALGYTDTPFP